jgi:hypothetical protein
VIIDTKDFKILKTNFSNGKKHDFRLFKESKPLILKNTLVRTDTGYQGIQKIHPNSNIPFKKKETPNFQKKKNCIITSLLPKESS